MTPLQIHRFIVNAPKGKLWTETEGYRAWRQFIEDLGLQYGVKLDRQQSSAEDAYTLVEAGADGNQIAAVWSLLFG
jgi:hypothetical protein